MSIKSMERSFVLWPRARSKQVARKQVKKRANSAVAALGKIGEALHGVSALPMSAAMNVMLKRYTAISPVVRPRTGRDEPQMTNEPTGHWAALLASPGGKPAI
jgi:hypothetical protein